MLSEEELTETLITCDICKIMMKPEGAVIIKTPSKNFRGFKRDSVFCQDCLDKTFAERRLNQPS